MRLPVKLPFFAAFLSSPLIYANPGDLDPAFAGFGWETTQILNNPVGRAVAVQPDAGLSSPGTHDGSTYHAISHPVPIRTERWTSLLTGAAPSSRRWKPVRKPGMPSLCSPTGKIVVSGAGSIGNVRTVLVVPL